MSILPLMMVAALVWGVAAGYGIPAFIDWTKAKREQQIREGLK